MIINLNKRKILFSVISFFITFFSITVIYFLSEKSMVHAQEQNTGSGQLIDDDIMLEEFMYGTEWVTIASKHKQKREEVPSAVYVITAEDIEQSGAVRLADVFRMAPGMDVVSVDGNSSLVSIRGFAIDTLGINGVSNLAEFSKRLLVMVDDRAIYNPAFGGVFWDQEPVFLEDIERIEIIRGPGAALYGANAVNGVINIITKDPEKTKGTSVKATYGSQDTLIGNMTYGNSAGNFHYRLTGGYREDDGYDDGVQADQINDFKDFKREPKVNFRGKYEFENDTNAEIFAGFMDGAEGEQFGGQLFFNSRDDIDTATTRDMTRAFVQARFNKEISDTSDFHIQVYSDYTDIDEDDTIIENQDGNSEFILSPFEMDVRQYDIEFEHSFELGSKNLITWGTNYRNNQLWSRMTGSKEEFDEEIEKGEMSQKFKQESNDIFGLFLQDNFKILDNLGLTIGGKMEKNSFSGSDLSPRVSLVYSPWKHHSFRASYSRAYRTPTFLEESGFFTIGTTVGEDGVNRTFTVGEVGNNDLDSERLDSYEIGYMGVYFDRLEFNAETFFTRYKDLITFDSGDSGLNNTSRADTSGFEVSIRYPVVSWLEFNTNYSYINFIAKIDDESSERETPDNTTPEQKANFGLLFKTKSGFSVNLGLHYVDQIKIIDEVIDDYLRADLRLSQKFLDGKGEISLVGQNMQEYSHEEFIDVEVDRAVYLSVGINF